MARRRMGQPRAGRVRGLVGHAGRLARLPAGDRDLLVSPPEQKIKDFMVAPAITVQATESQEEVAGILAKYNLLALPITDAAGRMQGIATVDDAIDSVIPGAWKRRLPRVFGP